MTTKSVFAKHAARQFDHRYRCTIRLRTLAGGVPKDPKVVEAWLRTKLAEGDDLIRERIAETMIAMDNPVDGTSPVDAATAEVADMKTLTGFKRDANGLYEEGRKIKAMLKEAVNVAASAGHLAARGWGKTNKGIKGWTVEHVFIPEDRIPLCRGDQQVAEPDGIATRFVHTFRGNGIAREEYLEDVEMTFTVETDADFSADEWATIWVTAERNGFGATRSQGYGRFDVVQWELIP